MVQINTNKNSKERGYEGLPHYKTISLLNHVTETLRNVVPNRLQASIEPHPREEQAEIQKDKQQIYKS